MSEERIREDRAAQPEGENWLERLLQRLNPRSRESARGDLEEALSEPVEADDFSPQERAMLRNVLDFHRIRVNDVMVPRADIVAVAADSTLAEVLSLFRTAGHSRLPVFGETLDDPLGMVHIRDFMDIMAPLLPGGPVSPENSEISPPAGAADLSSQLSATAIVRPVLFVPASMRAVDLLVRMQAKRTHIALVIDEYGGTEGLVSIEDIVETVVGDIEDEHDDPTDEMITAEEGGTFLADARAGLEKVSEALATDLGATELADEIDTLGGLIVTLAGRVPSRGELIAGPSGLEFEVIDADPRRLKKVRIHRRPGSAGDGALDPAARGATVAPQANADRAPENGSRKQ